MLISLSSIFINHFIVGLRRISHAEPHGRSSEPGLSSTVDYGASLTTMGGNLSVSLRFATPPTSVPMEEHEGDWDDVDGSVGEHVEMDALTA